MHENYFSVIPQMEESKSSRNEKPGMEEGTKDRRGEWKDTRGGKETR
jgi:hypothetical protein